jgi:hypothetical protein
MGPILAVAVAVDPSPVASAVHHRSECGEHPGHVSLIGPLGMLSRREILVAECFTVLG